MARSLSDLLDRAEAIVCGGREILAGVREIRASAASVADEGPTELPDDLPPEVGAVVIVGRAGRAVLERSGPGATRILRGVTTLRGSRRG